MLRALPAFATAAMLAFFAPGASAQAPKPPAHSSAPAAKPGGPSWEQLTPDQKEALSPLQADWDQYDVTRKKKWLAIAQRYKDLSPEGQQRMHERMPDLARLTPEQRRTARENFRHAYSLPPDQRRALTQQFQDLPEEKKQQLAEQSKKKLPPPRREAGKPAAPRAPAAPGAAAPGGPTIHAQATPDGAATSAR